MSRVFRSAQDVADARLESRVATPDIRAENHGSLFLLRALRVGARRWLKAHVSTDARWIGPPTRRALVAEPRYVGDIVACAREAGLMVQ